PTPTAPDVPRRLAIFSSNAATSDPKTYMPESITRLTAEIMSSRKYAKSAPGSATGMRSRWSIMDGTLPLSQTSNIGFKNLTNHTTWVSGAGAEIMVAQSAWHL